MKYFLLLFFVITFVHAEPSAFGAGTIDSDNPYGLNESERMIVENRKVSLSNQKLIRRQAILIEQLQEKIEGLSSIIDSISSKIGQTGQKLNEISSKNQLSGEEELKDLQAQIDDLKKSSNENYSKINSSLKKLTKIMGSTSSNTKKKVDKKHKVKESRHISNAEILKNAVKAYRSKNYSKAEKFFTQLASKTYKPAQTNYYLGEIAYYTKKYEDAVSFYKTSVGYYDRASYMPTLLLHTAISFKNLGDIENSKRFFNTILDTYANSPEADIAQKYLN